MKKRFHAAQFVACLLVVMMVVGVVAIDKLGKQPAPGGDATPYPTGTEIIDIGGEENPMGGNAGVLITQTPNDIQVIPDKYNTGAKGELKKVGLGDVVEGIQLKADGTGTKNVFDFGYGNKSVSGTVIIEGYDFSDFDAVSYNEGAINRDIKIAFVNCKFAKVSKGIGQSRLMFEFQSCSMNNFSGSNAKFDACAFGGTCQDGLNPYSNVTISNSYFSDMTDWKKEGKGIHTDGTQIYGYKGVIAENISYNNCRFEMPAIDYGSDSASVNACFMLQLEFNSGSNISFKDCVINGGGYSIYARTVSDDLSMSNVSLENIRVGCSKRFGTFYPKLSDAVTIKNITETDKLYIGSVWNDGQQVHLSVSNDTNQERKLVVVTDKGLFEYTIPACPNGEEVVSVTSFDSLPYDIDIVVPEICEYVVCYDTSIAGQESQIRFVNWTNESVYVPAQTLVGLKGGQVSVISSGECGKSVNYKLTSDGMLTIYGTGATYDYHSQNLAPWNKLGLNYLIRTVVVAEGVTRLGNQIFNGCNSISEVDLPNGMLSVGTRAFAGSGSLLSITFPDSLEYVSPDAFAGSVIREVYCNLNQYNEFIGDQTIGTKLKIKEPIADKDLSDGFGEVSANILLEGKCGVNTWFTFDDEGTLTISGEGATYNYHSQLLPPWYEYYDKIQTLVVEEGITALGNQLLCRCGTVSSVILPDSLEIIGANVFLGCQSLQKIIIPGNVSSIGNYAFHATGLNEVDYQGTQNRWLSIQMGHHNDIFASLTINFMK